MAIDVVDRALRQARGNRPGEREEMRPPPPAPPKKAPSLADVLRRVNKPKAKPVAKAKPYVPPDSGRAAARPNERPVMEDSSYAPYRPVTGATHTTLPPRKPLPTRQPGPPIQGRPPGLTPPASTGPIISPQREVAARTAGAYGYGDEARRALGQTPLSWYPFPEENSRALGQYNPGTGAIELNSSVPGGQGVTLAHELSHKRWFEDLGAQNYDTSRDFVRDTNALARRGLDAAQGAEMRWERDKPYYGVSGGSWEVAPTELHARVAQDVYDPNQLPDWYRGKWFPQVWRPGDVRMGNQMARHDEELGPGYIPGVGAPDASGNYGYIRRR